MSNLTAHRFDRTGAHCGECTVNFVGGFLGGLCGFSRLLLGTLQCVFPKTHILGRFHQCLRVGGSFLKRLLFGNFLLSTSKFLRSFGSLNDRIRFALPSLLVSQCFGFRSLVLLNRLGRIPLCQDLGLQRLLTLAVQVKHPLCFNSS